MPDVCGRDGADDLLLLKAITTTKIATDMPVEASASSRRGRTAIANGPRQRGASPLIVDKYVLKRNSNVQTIGGACVAFADDY
jgi:hypothetical protein